ncbi:RNA pseudouridine synthase 5 isoform X2 [Vigna radiata var. radiata]|uniref:RNA pseudouridine synthase 5 isoform X2 n=1 Tax=Vigna radiata var. radiata TaxID=3916 RepID=A0A3Q0FC25_VIGRR|nr:RNA pseudouridine synthase 5 isoform X2 [Vigna radiata var. radiata]
MACRRKFGIPWPECNDGLSYDDVVRTSDSGLTLIEFYSTKYKSSAPLQGWLQRIKSGQITFDGRVVTDSNAVLRVGSKLVYHRLPLKEPDAPHMIEVLYEDDDMIALNKPSGLQVLPGGLFQQRTVLTQLQWEANLHKMSHPVPVHRLGRGTSGILLCAKTKVARARLASYFADGTSHIGGKRAILELFFGTFGRTPSKLKILHKGTLGLVNFEFSRLDFLI